MYRAIQFILRLQIIPSPSNIAKKRAGILMGIFFHFFFQSISKLSRNWYNCLLLVHKLDDLVLLHNIIELDREKFSVDVVYLKVACSFKSYVSNCSICPRLSNCLVLFSTRFALKLFASNADQSVCKAITQGSKL